MSEPDNNYSALVVSLESIRPHPNADSLRLALAGGYQIIIGMHEEEGDIGLLFPEGCQMGATFGVNNKLYRKNPATGEVLGGYIEENGRVKAVKLRKANSEALFCKLELLLNVEGATQDAVDDLKVGDSLSEWCGEIIAQRYISRVQRMKSLQNVQGGTAQKSLHKIRYQNFKEHKSTTKLRRSLYDLVPGSIIEATAKLHGTSGRTGSVKVVQDTPWYIRWTVAFLSIFGIKVQTDEWEVVTGTRRTVLRPESEGFHSGNFRQEIHNTLAPLLGQGETIYYEIVGYNGPNSLIMPRQAIPKSLKAARKLYGEEMAYSYGCNAEEGESKIYVYRITHTDTEGVIREIPQNEVERRCDELGLAMVPRVETWVYNGDRQALMDKCSVLSAGPDPLDPSHCKEGIVLRVTFPDGRTSKCYKYKDFLFCQLEGIQPNVAEDPEV